MIIGRRSLPDHAYAGQGIADNRDERTRELMNALVDYPVET
jgi:hypothetical protein